MDTNSAGKPVLKYIVKKIFLSLLLCYSISLLFSCPVRAEDEKVTINVGINKDLNLYSLKDGEEVTGYVNEYMQILLSYSEVPLKIRYTIDTPDKLKKLLAAGEIDFLITDNINNTNMNKLETSIGTIVYSLYCKENNHYLLYEDYQNMQNIKVGFLNNSMGALNKIPFLQDHDIIYTSITYNNMSELTKALQNNEIDAAYIDNHADGFIKSIADVTKKEVYIWYNKDNSITANYLVRAQNRMLLDRAGLISELENEYYGKLLKYQAFTREEQEFISHSGEILVSCNSSKNPLEYYDSAKNTYNGIHVGVLNLVSKFSGLQFKYVNSKVDENKGPDLILSMYDLQGLNKDDIALTNNYETSNFVVLGPLNDQVNNSDVYKVAITNYDTDIIDYIKKYYPQWKIIIYDCMIDCVSSVRNSNTNFTIQDYKTLEGNIGKLSGNDLGILSVLSSDIGVSMGVVKKGNYNILLSILNKSISAITVEQYNECVFKNTEVINKTDSFRLYMQDHLLMIFLFMLLLLFSIGIILIYFKINISIIESKYSFLTNISHEIRTALNGISGITQLASEDFDNMGYRQDYYDRISNSTNYLLSITNDVLDLSKLKNNKMQIHNSFFDLRQVLISFYDLLGQQQKRKGIGVKIIVNGLIPKYLYGDATRLEQIFINLVGNAIKYTQPGGKVWLIVTIKKITDNEATIEFKVADNGSGMESNSIKKLFNKYERDISERAKIEEGYGLGLSITKELVMLMGGELKVCSEVNVGSCFYFQLKFHYSIEYQDVSIYNLKSNKILVLDSKKQELVNKWGAWMFMGYKADAIILDENKENLLKYTLSESRDYEFCYIDKSILTKSLIDLITENSQERLKLVCVEMEKNLNQNTKYCDISSDLVNVTLIMPTDISYLKTYKQIDRRIKQNKPDKVFTRGVNKKYAKIPYLSNKRVLIAEDNEINMGIITEVLSATSIKIEKAADGLEACSLFERSPIGYYDYLLMDIHMPKRNGQEAASYIRKLHRKDAKKIIIIAMTAEEKERKLKKTRLPEMNYYIMKPYNIGEIYDLFNMILETIT